jgi:predicted RNA binding protein YcfA (HicA-like mRNA interferase family)
VVVPGLLEPVPSRESWQPGLVTVSGHPADDLARGTLNSILKQAGLE